MANIPIDKVFNQKLYAKSRVTKLSSPGGSVVGIVEPGGLIGTIYSYVVKGSNVYWMMEDIFGSQTFFVEHNPNNLNLPNKQQILNDIARQAEQQKMQDKGILQYNIDKYLPWVIGAGVAALVVPTLLNTKKINGVKKRKSDTGKFVAVAAIAVGIYLLTKKKRKAGTPIVEVIDEGFVNQLEPGSVSTPTPVKDANSFIEDSFGNLTPMTVVSQPTNTGGGGGYYAGSEGKIDYVGPFEVSYQQNMMAGSRSRKKGNIGKYTTI